MTIRTDTGETDLDPGPAPTAAHAPAPPWQRALVVIGAALTLVLLGAAGGMLIRLPGTPGPPPAADSVDVGFAQDMSVHHEQAVQMASWERDHSSDPTLRQVAFDIESSQTSQIGQMQGWLSLWDAGLLPIGGHMAWMSTASGHDHSGADPTTGAVATMPGMASTDELRGFRAATGPQLDVLFLQLMIRHHQGGAAMLSYAAQHASVPQVRILAASMLSSQTAESPYLQQLLAERGGTPLPL